jgi:hypothetical protein
LVHYPVWFLIAFTTVAVAGLLLAFGRLSLRLDYRRRGNDDRLLVEVALWGPVRYRMCIPVLQVAVQDAPGLRFDVATEGKPPEGYFTRWTAIYRAVTRVLRLYTRYRRVLSYLWRRWCITGCEWHTTVGTGDPAATGFIAGLFWGVKGFLAGRLSPQLKTLPKYSVTPDFFLPAFQTSFSLAASVALRHFLVAGLYLLWCRRKGVRGGAGLSEVRCGK